MFQFILAGLTFLAMFIFAPVRGVAHRFAVGITMAAHVLEV